MSKKHYLYIGIILLSINILNSNLFKLYSYLRQRININTTGLERSASYEHGSGPGTILIQEYDKLVNELGASPSSKTQVITVGGSGGSSQEDDLTSRFLYRKGG